MALCSTPREFRHATAISLVAPLLVIGLILLGGCRSESARDDGSDHQTPPAARQALAEARTAMDDGNFVLALERIEDAAVLDPESPDMLVMRGNALMQLDRLEEARFALETLLNRYPGHKEGWGRLGNVALRQDQLAEAIEHYRKQIRIESTPASWYNLSLAHAELNDYASAREALQQAIKLNSDYANGYAALADLSEKEGDFTTALEYARQAAAKQPSDRRFQEKLGFMLLRNGQNEEAIQVLEPVLEEAPWDYQSRYNLGQALQRLGRTAEAEAQLRQAESDRERQAQMRRLERSVHLDPTNGRLHFALGIEYQKWGRLDDALRSYQIAKKLVPDNLLVDFNMATLYLHRNELDEAQRRFKEILRQDSSMGAAWLNLGFTAARMDSMRQAEAAWSRAIAIDPGYREAVLAFQQRPSTRQ